MENLPKLLGKPVKEVIAEVGTSRDTFARWCRGKIPCSALVRVCNTYRISLSSFLVLKENPELMKRATDYVRPAGSWTPVEWDSRPIGTLFGAGGLTRIPGIEAARRLGFSSKQIFDRWACEPDNCRVDDLLRMLNEFRMDASLFFTDANSPVPLPAWEAGDRHIADIVASRMEGYREMERRLAEKESENRSLRAANERLAMENLRLKQHGQASAGKPSGPFGESGYVFHQELWDSLPGMSGMTRKDFCREIGISYNASYKSSNIAVSSLVKACNMLRMSVSHFFVPKGEVPMVYDSGFYTVSPRMFVPIEDRMDNLRYIFGRYGVTDYTIEGINRMGIWQAQLYSMSRQGGPARVLTLCDICTALNIPPYIFFSDENRRKAEHHPTANERLLLNAIDMAREIESLRARIRKMKDGKE